MAYQKQTWVTGETITEQKLNHMEDGIANTILAVDATVEEVEGDLVFTLDKTWQQIHDASYAFLADGETYHPIYRIWLEDGKYRVQFSNGLFENMVFRTETADGYPQVSGK